MRWFVTFAGVLALGSVTAAEPLKYEGVKTGQISFPLGGIGTGSIGLGGNGGLIDWEIFNAPNKGSLNGHAHFAIRTEQKGKTVDVRILNGDLQPPYIGSLAHRNELFVGFGWGPRAETMAGLPHFRNHTFLGSFPTAKILFSDPEAPVKAELVAWSPFIPSNADDSSRPLAIFEITVENTTQEPCDYALTGVLANPYRTQSNKNAVVKHDGLTQLILTRGGDTTDFEYGELALTTDAAQTSYQEYFFRGGWSDPLEAYYHDLKQSGPFKNRRYETSIGNGWRQDSGLLAAHFSLKPGERQTVNYIISWHSPNRRELGREADERAKESGIANRWLNYYAKLQTSAADGAVYAFANYARLRKDTFAFRDALFNSKLPQSVIDGVSANLSTLRSPVAWRLEDGTFYGWEGVGTTVGSCAGSCSHVWNYAQALPFLFPELERTMRNAQYFYNVDENGGAHFRLKLPLGCRAKVSDHRPCVDGQFGEVMKTYREWKLSGKTDWLKSVYPTLKRTIEYAWSEKNYDRWDPEQSGVMRGRQHNTLDIEFFGPSGYLNAHYLGALKAGAEIADAMGDKPFAELCRGIFAKGKAWTDKNLFNGEIYFQDIDVTDESILNGFDDHGSARDYYWNAEHKQIKYQLGPHGRIIDAPLAQWYATLYGIGEILAPEQVKTNLETLYKYNFLSMRDVANTWRIFGLNDEKGVIMSTWPDGIERPVIPACYSTELFNGQEWAFASHLALFGELDKATAVADAIRHRYDGERRNPWSEIECGSNYARSMASYGMLLAWSGFTFDLTQNRLGFSPRPKGDFQCFWSVDGAWGEFMRAANTCTLTLAYGKLNLQTFAVEGQWKTAELNGKPIDIAATGQVTTFSRLQTLAAGDTLTLRR